INRFPIDASAKCNGTRSGVSMIRTSSVASVADINPYDLWLTFSCDPDEASLPHLYQECVVSREIHFEIGLRAAFAINRNSALFDQSSRFSHRRRELKFNQQLRQLPHT